MTQFPPGDIGLIGAQLNRSADRLVRELLPAGRRFGRQWRVGDVSGAPGTSLAIELAGRKAGLWHDHATGEGGDALALIAAARYGGRLGPAVAWAKAWLGWSASCPHPAPKPPPHQAATVGDAGEDAGRRSKAAVRLFTEAAPIPDTPAEAYLAGRSIDLRALGRAPGALRFHPRAWCSEVASPLPALLAAVVNAGGAMIGVHRIYLAKDSGGQWRKAPLRTVKMSLGPVRGGFVALWRGQSGMSPWRASGDDAAIVAEGIENALAIAVSTPQHRVLSTVSLGGLCTVELPAQLRRITVAGDNDSGNPRAQQLLLQAAQRLALQGRQVRLAVPDTKDFNDLLIGGDA